MMLYKLIKRFLGQQRLAGWSTFKAWQQFKSSQIRVHPQVHTRFCSDSQLKGNGTLTLGSRWPNCRFYASEFIMQSQANLIVHGDTNVFTGLHIVINANATLELGSGYINNHVTIDCFQQIKIGHDVAIGKGVTLRDSHNHSVLDMTGDHANQHDQHNQQQQQRQASALHPHSQTAAIVIGDHVWIGTNATLLPGITIGDHAVIAAGAVVTQDVAANTLVGGVPAKVIKNNISWQ